MVCQAVVLGSFYMTLYEKNTLGGTIWHYMAVTKDFMNYRARLIDKMKALYDDYDTFDDAIELDTDLREIDMHEDFG